MSNAILTHPVRLYYSSDSGVTFTELVEVKNYPNLFTPAEGVDKTTLAQLQETMIKGIKGAEAMEFECNYNKEDFNTVYELEDDALVYKLSFGENDVNGAFVWSGEHAVTMPSGDVNSIVNMLVTVYPSSEVLPIINITLANSSPTVTTSGTSDEAVTTYPAGATVTYSSDDVTKFTVDEDGLISGVGAGVADLIIEASYAGYFTTTTTVEVTVTTP